MKKPRRIILIDADIVSHFIKAGQLLLLPRIFSFPICVLDKVYAELENFRSKKTEVDNLVNMKLVSLLAFPEEDANIRKEYYLLKKQNKGDGEAACMAMALFQKHILASSNLRDVAQYCHLNSIDHLTTMDFLCEALKKGIYTLNDCDDFIQKALAKGGKLPVQRMQEYICQPKYFI